METAIKRPNMLSATFVKIVNTPGRYGDGRGGLGLGRGRVWYCRFVDGDTPLHKAALLRDIQVVSAMIDGGANAGAISESGWTPLHGAALRSENEDAADVAQLLIRSGADANRRDAYGRTPLHVAAASRNQQISLIDALVDGGAEPNVRDEDGETPLFVAVGSSFSMGTAGNHAIVSRLIDAGADPNLRDASGSAPLHKALSRFSPAGAVEALLDGGAEVALKDDDGLTPWEIAQNHESLKGTNTYWRLNDARFD